MNARCFGRYRPAGLENASPRHSHGYRWYAGMRPSALGYPGYTTPAACAWGFGLLPLVMMFC